jgi:hypothetical protein
MVQNYVVSCNNRLLAGLLGSPGSEKSIAVAKNTAQKNALRNGRACKKIRINNYPK